MINDVQTNMDSIKVQRDRIDEFEYLLSQQEGAVKGDSDLFPLHHSFGDGIYCREISLPKGSVCVGKLHKTCHPNFLMKGEVIVTSNVSEEKTRYVAPVYFMSGVGVKKVVYAVEDSVWVTVHPTQSQDLKIIEDELIAKDYAELDSITEKYKELV